MTQWKVAIVGAGIISKTHARTILENGRSTFVAIADIARDKAEEFGQEYGVAAYTDYKQMVQEQKPDIVIVTLPHFLHKEASIWCAEQGCHILLEKPMAMDATECEAINEAASRHGIVLAVGHMQHYAPAMLKAKEIYDSGTLGQLVMVLDRRHHPYFTEQRPAWFLDASKSGGGVTRNLGSHSIDKLLWLTGKKVEQVNASLTYYGDRGNVDGSANLYLRLTGEATASLSLCGYHNVSVNETELLFTNGQLKLKGMDQLWIGTHEQPYEPIDVSQYPNAFTAQWDDFLDAIAYRKPIGISGAYGQYVASIVDAAYRSHAAGASEQLIVTQQAKQAKLIFHRG